MPEDLDWPAARARLEATERALEAAASPERARQVLEERARRWALRPDNEQSRAETQEVVVFSVAGQSYGIAPVCVREVLRACLPTPLPGARPHICGVIHHRGQVLAVLDLRGLAGSSAPAGWDVKAPVVVVEARGMTFGIRADSISGIARAGVEPAGPAATAPGTLPATIRSTAEGMLRVLDIEALARDPRITVNDEAR
jgi:chemotaxis signal transduction protein